MINFTYRIEYFVKMKDEENIEKIYIKNEEIKKIVEELKKYSFEDYQKSLHYELSLLSKGTEEEELKKIYPQFYLIKLVLLRKRKSGYDNYDICYELDKGNYALFAIHFEKGKKPEMVNAFIENKIFKNFLKAMIRRYGKEMI